MYRLGLYILPENKFYNLTIITMTKHIKNFEWVVFWNLQCTWECEKRWQCRYQKCKCLLCWNEKFINRSTLYRHITKSCWCQQAHTKHWMTWTRFNKIWLWMKGRCYNKHSRVYQWYWWRWIEIEWKTFEEFRDDMYESYLEHVEQYWEKETTIDRIDVNGNYCKKNCRWATNLEQSKNTRHCNKVVYKGKEYQTRMDLIKEKWLNYKTIEFRLRKWIDLETAIDTATIVDKPRDSKWRYMKFYDIIKLQWQNDGNI